MLLFSKSGDLSPLVVRTGGSLYFHNPRARRKGLYQGLAKVYGSGPEALSQKPDAVIFDMVGLGQMADTLRNQGVPVWGAGRIQDHLELDRVFGLELMVKHGIRVPTTLAFGRTTGEPWQKIDLEAAPIQRVKGHIKEAREFVRASGERFVLKPDDNLSTEMSYVSKDAEDLDRFLAHVEEYREVPPEAGFLLQRHVAGAEVSTEGWISNGDIVPPCNQTLETKKFLAGDLGPNTGCQTSVVWGCPENARLVKETLFKIRSWLKRPYGPEGEPYPPYHGPLDINCIIDEKDKKPWGLEWTPRHGYNAVYALAELMQDDLRTVWVGAATGRLPTMRFRPGYAYGLRVTIPPYPMLESLDDKKDADHIERMLEMATHVDILGPYDDPHVWLLDAQKYGKGVWTAGVDGVVLEVTGTAARIETARDTAHTLYQEFDLADSMARTVDGADRAIRDIAKLRSWGYEVPA